MTSCLQLNYHFKIYLFFHFLNIFQIFYKFNKRWKASIAWGSNTWTTLLTTQLSVMCNHCGWLCNNRFQNTELFKSTKKLYDTKLKKNKKCFQHKVNLLVYLNFFTKYTIKDHAYTLRYDRKQLSNNNSECQQHDVSGVEGLYRYIECKNA